MAAGSDGEIGAALVTAAEEMGVWIDDGVAVTGSSVARVVVTGVDVTSEPPPGSHTVVITSTVLMTCCVTVNQTRSRFGNGTAAAKPTRGKRAMVVDAFILAVEIAV